jgi:CMP-N-acetylneuraminic acid synthetase
VNSAVIAYIPARGGSKRIPRKNMLPLGGKPVIEHVIAAVNKLPFVSAVCVSSDDGEILSTAAEAGAVTLEPRASHLSNDYAPLAQLLKEDVGRFLDHAGVSGAEATVLFVLPTAALVPPALFERAYQRYREMNAAILIATKSYPSSPFRALVRRDDGSWAPLFPEMLPRRTQDMPAAEVDSGLFYVINYQTLSRHEGHWFTVPSGLECFSVPDSVALDVDTMEDWAELERRFRHRCCCEAAG